MVYRAISDHLKECALWLLEAGHITEDVCDLLGVSQASLHRWKRNHEDYGSVRPPPNPLHDTGISRTALHMLINDSGLTYKILRRAASERDEVARTEWKHLIQTSFISSMIVTADESSKDERTIFRKRGRAPRGHPFLLPSQLGGILEHGDLCARKQYGNQ
ncbi:hypothetical protein B0H11DRAFT_2163450 [Mycena galericulata]|nr:hypothetical protein B0H11DRAFT_2163450 [Mycena galericulata]